MSAVKKKTLVRSVSLPVAECLSHPKAEFMAALHAAWRQSTDLANWASHTLARLDVVRTPGLKELPKMAPVDLYALAFGRAKEGQGRQMWMCSACAKKWHPVKLSGGNAPEHLRGKGPCPGGGKAAVELARRVLPTVEAQFSGFGGCKASAASLLSWVAAKYGKERPKIVWRRDRRSPEFLYPLPFPVHADAWAVYFGGDNGRGQPALSVTLPGGRFSLRLRNGPEFCHAVKVLRRIEAGDLKQMELKLCRQRTAAHYLAAEQGGVSYRVMARVSYAMDVPDCPAGEIATVKTGGDPFLTLTVHGREQLFWHLPQVRAWILEHERFLAAYADDMKFEKRWPAKKKARFLRKMERGCDKHARRMKSLRQETAHQVVAACARRGCGVLHWDDADRSFAEKYPWAALRQCVQNKCDEFGIALVLAGGAEVEYGEEVTVEETN